MKKLLICALAATAVFASCSKTDIHYNGEPQEITFKKVEGAMTKSDPLANTVSLGVIAYLHGGAEYFSNAQFSKGEGAHWSGSKYWPLQDALDFVVYAPYQSSDVTYTTTGEHASILSIVYGDNSTTQTDYLYGSKYFNGTGNGYEKQQTAIPVDLNHALSKITINISANKANVFTLTDLTLNNTYQAGTFNVKYASPNVITTSETGTQYTKDYTDASTPIGTANTVFDNFLVFPSAQTSITLKYKVAGTNDNELTAQIPLNVGSPAPKWESGKHYTYNITLTAEEILFDATVNTWTTGTTDPIEL